MIPGPILSSALLSAFNWEEGRWLRADGLARPWIEFAGALISKLCFDISHPAMMVRLNRRYSDVLGVSTANEWTFYQRWKARSSSSAAESNRIGSRTRPLASRHPTTAPVLRPSFSPPRHFADCAPHPGPPDTTQGPIDLLTM